MTYMAYIDGWQPVIAFGSTEIDAKKLALRAKKKKCRDDLEKWTWDRVHEYYGAWVEEVKDGKIINL